MVVFGKGLGSRKRGGSGRGLLGISWPLQIVGRFSWHVSMAVSRRGTFDLLDDAAG